MGAAFLLVGASSMIWNVITVSLRQAMLPDHLLGRVNSGYRLLAWGSMPVGAAIAGLSAELIGPRGVFAGFAVASLLLVWPLRRLTDTTLDALDPRRGPTDDRPPAAPDTPAPRAAGHGAIDTPGG